MDTRGHIAQYIIAINFYKIQNKVISIDDKFKVSKMKWLQFVYLEESSNQEESTVSDFSDSASNPPLAFPIIYNRPHMRIHFL